MTGFEVFVIFVMLSFILMVLYFITAVILELRRQKKWENNGLLVDKLAKKHKVKITWRGTLKMKGKAMREDKNKEFGTFTELMLQDKVREIVCRFKPVGKWECEGKDCSFRTDCDEEVTKLQSLYKPEQGKIVYGLKTVFDKIRIDTRWTEEDYIKRMRKGERLVKFKLAKAICEEL